MSLPASRYVPLPRTWTGPWTGRLARLVAPFLLLGFALRCAPDGTTGPGPVATVVVRPDSAVLRAVGDTVRLRAIALSPAGDTVRDAGFAWTTANAAVARVDSSGLVAATGRGGTVITATAEGAAGTAEVTVQFPFVVVAPEGVSLTGVGASTPLSATRLSATGRPLTGGSFNWSSLNPAVATVDADGVVRATGAGQATIAASSDGEMGYALVTVADPAAPAAIRWERMATGVAHNLTDVWGTSATDVYAVGYGGVVLHYDGTSWTTVYSGPTWLTLQGVWGTSATNVYAVGVGGTILHFDGSNWTPVASGTTQWLWGVWGSSPTDVYVVGYGGVILHGDGTTWTPMASGTTHGLRAVWGTSSQSIYVSTDGGEVLRFNGTAWSLVTGPNTTNFMGLWGTTPTRVFAVGAFGWILRGTP